MTILGKQTKKSEKIIQMEKSFHNSFFKKTSKKSISSAFVYLTLVPRMFEPSRCNYCSELENFILSCNKTDTGERICIVFFNVAQDVLFYLRYFNEN